MNKYIAVFLTDWQNQFVYRLNFIFWRLRNILRLLMVYFLWVGVYASGNVRLGLGRAEMLSYVLIAFLVQSLVLSSSSADNVGGEIGSGQLSNFLTRPVNYLSYWFVRDVSGKLLNLVCAVIEVAVLWLLLRPELYFSFNPVSVFWFSISCLLAIPIFFFLSLLSRLVAFWYPENTWGLSFLLLIFVEILSGLMFPLTVLPDWASMALQFSPFPYLIYFPVSILLGQVSGIYLIKVLLQTLIWLTLLFLLVKSVWRRGLRVYGSEGN